MTIPILKGTIKRRILVNFRADPAVVCDLLPSPFRPKLHRGHAIVGVCLIRLEDIRPVWLPLPVGFSSENAAHRIAVLWNDAEGNPCEGVFIPRRDTGSVLNHLTGGRLFPGQHHFASFQVHTKGEGIALHMRSQDGEVEVRVAAQPAEGLPSSSCFSSLEEASAFFESGCVGYSARCSSDGLDGLILKTQGWRVEALSVSEAYSSYYASEARFPRGSIVLDHALLMRDIAHEWHPVKEWTRG